MLLLPFLFFFLFSVTLLLRFFLLLLLLLLLRLLVLLLLLLLLRLLVLLLLLLLLHLLVLLLGLRFVLPTCLLPLSGDHLSGAALESFLPPTALAAMVLLKKLLTIMLTLPVFTPIRILPMKTLPVLRLSLIPRQPCRSIPFQGSVNIAGRISVIRGPTVIRAVKIV